MPLSGYALIISIALAGLNITQCSRANDLREQIGEERQKCATEFAEYRAERQALINTIQADAAREREQIQEIARQLMNELQAENHALLTQIAEQERTLTAAMRRAQTEDAPWCAMPVPPYLLQD